MPARRSACLVTLCMVATMAAGVVVAGPASADELDDKRREAAAVADQLEKLQVSASVLDEQYNQVATELTTLEGEVAKAEADVARHDAALGQMRGEASGLALRTYMNPDAGSPLSGITSGSSAGNLAAQRAGYTSVAFGLSTALTDQLKALTDDAQAARQVLADKRERQAELQTELAERRVEVDGAITDHEELQSQVQGELARLVAEEQARREAAEAAAARQRVEAEAQRRAAAEREAADRAAREAAERSSSASSSSEQDDDNGSSGSSGSSSSSGGGQSAQPEQREESPREEAPPAQEEPEEEEEEESSGGGAGSNVPSPSPGASGAVSAAMSQIGVGYRFATAIPGVAFDCSGLTKWAWGQAGVSLPHSSKQQYASLPHVPADQAQPGDLFFFGSPIHHVGMYIGGGQMVNAVQPGTPVKVSNAYRKDLVGVARPG